MYIYSHILSGHNDTIYKCDWRFLMAMLHIIIPAFPLWVIKIVRKIITRVSPKCSNLLFQSVILSSTLHTFTLTLTDIQQPVLTAICFLCLHLCTLTCILHLMLSLLTSVCTHLHLCSTPPRYIQSENMFSSVSNIIEKNKTIIIIF